MRNIFTEHPNKIGETYFQHFCFAGKFGLLMVIGGLACITHAIFPFVFKDTASNYLLKMTENFISRLPAMQERVMKIKFAIEAKQNETSHRG